MITDAHLRSPTLSRLLQETVNTRDFSKINDEILYLVEMSADPQEIPAQQILARLKQREIYRYIGQVTTTESRFANLQANGLSRERLAQYGLKDEDVIVQHLRISYTNSGMYPLRKVCFYHYEEPDRAVKIPKSKLGNLLPQNFCERNTIRLFSRDNHDKVQQLMDYLVDLYQK
jgi:hypothetical protein